MEDTRKSEELKMVALEFRVKYPLNRGSKVGNLGLSGESRWFLGRMSWVLRRIDFRYDCGKVCLDVVSPSDVLSCGPWSVKLLGMESLTTEFLLEGLSLGRWGELRESISLHLVFLSAYGSNNQYTKMAYFRWRVLNSYGYILKWHILLPFNWNWAKLLT